LRCACWAAQRTLAHAAEKVVLDVALRVQIDRAGNVAAVELVRKAAVDHCHVGVVGAAQERAIAEQQVRGGVDRDAPAACTPPRRRSSATPTRRHGC
jgi:hypothetical protein